MFRVYEDVMPIRVLETTVAAQIAAGEVVERPASVVKELVENALDAGARKISVSVRGGGIEELVIQDDGCGIPADEIELAFQRHATSKLSSADDLWAIQTLGFRGEALPSIASVAQVSCLSRTADSPTGVELRIAGGELQALNPRGAAVGTTFTIRNLFYNIPVRREFLKSPAAEAGAISAVVTQYALAYPDIAFTLMRDGKRVFQTSGRGQLADVMLELYGVDVARQMIPVSGRAGEDIGLVEVQGLISAPSLSRSARDGMHITVNGRAIQPRGLLSTTIEEAYHTRLMKGRFPMVALQLRVHPAAVDVNVHPTKSEVKFRQPQLVSRTLGQAIHDALQSSSIVQRWADEAAQRAKQSAEPPPSPPERPRADTIDRSLARPPVLPRDDQHSRPVERYADRPAAPPPPPPPVSSQARLPELSSERPAPSVPSQARLSDPPSERPAPAPQPVAAKPPVAPSQPVPQIHETAGAYPAKEPQAAPTSTPVSDKLPPLRALAQLAQTYLLTEGPEGALYLIDQHAAHERITYERLLSQHASGTVQSQALLIPQDVALPPEAQHVLLDAADALATWGFALEEIERGVRVLSVPVGVDVGELPTMLADLASHLNGRGANTLLDQRDLLLATMACHTSVRAGQTLSLREQQALIEQLSACEGPRTCPHGRPTLIVISKHQLERQFGRLGA
jgi:DNA mismatch repair protein MutL